MNLRFVPVLTFVNLTTATGAKAPALSTTMPFNTAAEAGAFTITAGQTSANGTMVRSEKTVLCTCAPFGQLFLLVLFAGYLAAADRRLCLSKKAKICRIAGTTMDSCVPSASSKYSQV